jgi:hypothetical protein
MANSLHGIESFRPLTKVATGVVITMPDFPFCAAPRAEKMGFPLYGWDKIPGKNLHLSQVMMGEAPGDDLKPEPIPVTIGECVCTISGTGNTVSESQAAAYKNVDRIELPNSPMYRTDIGDRIKDQLPVLQKHGWMEDWEY